MFFNDIYTVPANTTDQAPSWRKLQVAKGTILKWGLYGPDEKADLLHVRIEYHGQQILPFGGMRWMYPFDSSHPIDENIKLSDSPYVLDVFAYNEDDTHGHEYILFVVIEPEKPVTPGVPISQSITDRLKQLFGV